MVSKFPQQRLIIVAPNGAYKSKSDHPNLPITPEEISNDVVACVNAGAGMVHLHARSEDGKHTLDIEQNYKVLSTVKKAIGDKAIIQLTTEAIGKFKPEQQMRLIRELMPEAASFALLELIPAPEFETEASVFFYWLAENNIMSQYIIYSPDQLAYYLDLRSRKLLPDMAHHILIVLGRYRKEQESHPEDISPFLPLIEQLDVRWAMCAFGKREQDCLVMAAQLGGDVRIGFENNIYKPTGGLAFSNADQVKRLADQLEEEVNLSAMPASNFRRCI